MSAGAPLVTVIIPAYNAAKTLDETLRSVRGQTYDNLEILVIDDGSKDETAAIVSAHAGADIRVRLITQANAGVAAARNNGLAQAKGELVAPVDADDLWHPEKIERQVAAMLKGGPRVGLVYNWFAAIDADSRITKYAIPHTEEGRVFDIMFDNKLIGNGSTPLMRRQVVLDCGGYDSGLHHAGAQGCEDLKLYLAIAEKHDYAVAPGYLTGYRIMAGNMSSDGPRMIRSHGLVVDEVSRRNPSARKFADKAHFDILCWYLLRALRERDKATALRLFGQVVTKYPLRTFIDGLFSTRGLFARLWRLATRSGSSSGPAPVEAGPLNVPYFVPALVPEKTQTAI